MDIVLIGKKSHNRNDAPHVVYCGQDRGEADAAVRKSAGVYVRVYELNSEPFRPMSLPAVPAPATAATESSQEPKPASKKAVPKEG